MFRSLPKKKKNEKKCIKTEWESEDKKKKKELQSYIWTDWNLNEAEVQLGGIPIKSNADLVNPLNFI